MITIKKETYFMGATFGNIHVHNQQKFSKDTLVNKLVEGFKSLNYEVSNQKHADINLKLLYNSSKKWITIYTDEIDEIQMRDLKRIVNFYHKIYSTDVIASHVIDSDILLMYMKGIKSDLYVSGVDDSEMTHYNRRFKSSKGSIEKWEHLLERSNLKTDLLNVWNTYYDFAEEKLAAIGHLIGFDDLLAQNGLKYFNTIADDISNYYEVVSLSFVNTIKLIKVSYIEGLPVFKNLDCGPEMKRISDERTLRFYNIGGKSKGILIEIFSDCPGIISFDSVETSQQDWNKEFTGKMPSFNSRRFMFERKENNKYVAVVDDFELSPGVIATNIDEIQRLKGNDLKKARKEIESYRQTFRYHLGIKGIANAIVTSNVKLKVIPLENPDGFVEFDFQLTNDEKVFNDYLEKELDNALENS
jgi:hypothetical protein